jgi:hypothetical protein
MKPASFARVMLFTVVCCLGIASAAAQQIVIDRDSALQSEPRSDSTIVANVREGTPGEALTRKGPWLNVKTRAGTGWVFAYNVRFVGTQGASGGAASPLGRLSTRQSLNVTSTIGTRGLDGEDLRKAQFNAQQIGQLERYVVSNQQARASAAASGLKAAQLDYLDKQP